MTSVDRIWITYQICFQAPFHLGTGLRRGLVHRGVARDAQGFLFVPGSTLKGIAREKCEQIASLFLLSAREPHQEAAALSDFGPGLGIVEDIFGARTRPGTIFFDDARMVEEDRKTFQPPPGSAATSAKFREFQVAMRTRVHISRLTRAAKRGHLFASEYGLREMRFTGTVSGVLAGARIESSKATYPLVMLVASLLAVEALGGERSCGAGQCRLEIDSVAVNGEAMEAPALLQWLPELEYYEIAKD